MILVISGTNRKGSKTLQVAKHYEKILTEKGENVKLLSLEQLNSVTRNANFEQLEAEYLKPATKFIILSPEYNGTFTGILKLMIDISDIRNVWHYKKAALVGISEGRAGNLRGLDQLTNALNYLKMNVMANKVPISGISKLLDVDGNVIEEGTREVIETQIDEFIKY
jgi:chromate reductase, NAD(P)H dehydrogenase (quinone)